MHTVRHYLAAAICLTCTAEALTLADFAPGALPGKSFELAFEGGDAVPPPAGTWKASFTATNVSVSDFPGVAGSHTSTWTATKPDFPDSYTYDLSASPAFGGKTSSLTLWISTPGPRFYLTIDGVGSYGGVTLAAAPGEAEISVKQRGGKEFANGKSTQKFTPVKVGKSGNPLTIEIRNSGDAPLKNIRISKNGANSADFIIGKPTKTAIPANGTATFTVTFRPKAKGTRKAAISIRSNDKDENPFNVSLTGEGLAN